MDSDDDGEADEPLTAAMVNKLTWKPKTKLMCSVCGRPRAECIDTFDPTFVLPLIRQRVQEAQ